MSVIIGWKTIQWSYTLAKLTMADVANRAGVGIATVDRVLNGRRKVREETARRVYEAALELGYHSTPVMRYRLEGERPQVSFGFVLPKEHQPFYQQLSRDLRHAVENHSSVRGRARFFFAESQSPVEHSDLILRAADAVDVIAASAVTHPKVSQAAGEARAADKPVFAILNDFAPNVCQGYVGLDNYRAGRVAGWLLTNAIRRTGSVAVLVGGNLWQGHQLRESGLRAFFRENNVPLQIRDTVLNVETRKVTYEVMHNMLTTWDDLCGLYVTGGGAEGVLDALREVTTPHPIKVIAHVLNDELRAALADNRLTAVIRTPTQELAKSVVEQMVQTKFDPSTHRTDQTILRPEIVLPEYL